MAGSRSIGAAALVVGFGTSLVMWTLGFAARIPPAAAPSWLLLFALVGCLAAGGAVAARATGGRPAAGAAAGSVASLVNLLVLGSLLTGDEPNRILPAAAVWLPGSLVAGALFGVLGALAGGRTTRAAAEDPNWTGAFARVAAFATLVLVMLGGLVTSKEAGLAVVDWPNSFGYNMFLYPLSRMTGGVYYEHAHRLFGSLVGLTTIALFFRIVAVDRRGWLKGAAGLAVLLVIGQGILGGLRVTGHFTTSVSPEVTRPSLTLAMVHGVTGQIFFAWMVCLTAFTSRTWRDRIGAVPSPAAGADRAVAAAVLIALLVQLFLGIRTRHTGDGTMLHITFAIVVLVLAVIAGVRTLGGYEHVRALRKAGGALLGHVTFQIVLGGLAFYLVSARDGAGTPPPAEVWVATLHQTVGALLLGNAALLLMWTRRLLVPVPVPAGSPAAARR